MPMSGLTNWTGDFKYSTAGGLCESHPQMPVQHLGAFAHRLAVERLDDMAVVDDVDAVGKTHGGGNILLDHHDGLAGLGM
jgi:hypothetical protein